MRKILTSCLLVVLIFINSLPLASAGEMDLRAQPEPVIPPIRNVLDVSDTEQIALARALNLEIDITVATGTSIQPALNISQCGDSIILQAGGTYLTPADFVAYTAPFKLCSDGSFITIKSSIPAPADGTRVTLADRARMPKLVARAGSPGFFDIENKAHHYRFSHLWFTNQRNSGGSGTSYLIGGGQDNGGVFENFARDIVVDHCFFNPLEWDEENGQNLYSSVNYATNLGGINITIRDSYMDGFGARYFNNKTTILDSGCALIGTSPGPYTFDNNFCSAWFVGFFIGGGDPGTTNKATVTASTSTSLTLSQAANLFPGDYISYRVPAIHPDNPAGDTWGASIVKSVSGLNVELEIQTQVAGLNDNKRNGPPALIGGEARWRGWIPSDIRITQNFFFKPDRWTALNGSAGKGFFEVKLCDRCLVDGNIFDGPTGFTVTVRNQGGAAAWSVIKNFKMSNNLATRFSVGMATLFYDNQRLSMPSTNIEFSNNLMYGDTGPHLGNDNSFGLRPKLFTGSHGDDIRFIHNTGLQSGEIVRLGNGAEFADKEKTTRFVWRDNITNWGTGEQHGYNCLNTTTADLTVCTPGYEWTKNVIIGAPTGPLQDARSMANFPPGNFNPATFADVRFTDPANNNYRLRSDSPYKNAGTDGKDIGVDMDQLLAHLGGDIPAPNPTPLPSPLPSVTPTPSPSPSVTPAPGGQIILSGRTLWIEGGVMPFMVVVLSNAQGQLISEFQTPQTGVFSFTVPAGSYQLHVKENGHNATPGRIYVTSSVSISGLDFMNNPNGWKPDGPPRCIPVSPCPPGATPSPTPSVTPTPTPTPTATPTPLPSPSPSPSPTPTPSPVIGSIEGHTLSLTFTQRVVEINNLTRDGRLRFVTCAGQFGNECYFERKQ